MATIRRALTNPIEHASAPVSIVQGARGVGKTVLIKDLLDPTDTPMYASFQDPRILSEAQLDPLTWLTRQGDYLAIDEAQLLPGLQLAVKAVVDEPGSTRRFILTGSAQLPSAELGGDAALTRRAQYFTLKPLTQWELNGGPGSVVDALYDAPLTTSTIAGYDEQGLLDMETVGGFPQYAAPGRLMTISTIIDRTASDIDATLTSRLIPDAKIDATIAKSILESLLLNPGGLFAADPSAKRLEIARNTVMRYMEILRRLFLIHWLPNIAHGTKTQNGPSRSKVHPVDTSFAVAALHLKDSSQLSRPETRGALLESLVANELIASSEWSACKPRPTYWRSSNGKAEVDLILKERSGRIVGIEIKSSSQVSSSDAKGLLAFHASKKGPLHRGFVVYPGEVLRELAENIWALPLRALLEPETFQEYLLSESPKATDRDRFPIVNAGSDSNGLTRLYDASIFLSYVHADDDFTAGAITKFADDLVSSYEAITGRPIRLFTDKSINWGEAWQRRLDHETDQTSFLLPAVSPRYLNSAACIDELTKFSASSQGDASRTILPLLAIDINSISDNDYPVLQTLRNYQFVNIDRPLDDLLDEPDDKAYRRFVKETARKLAKVVRRRDEFITNPESPTGETPPEDKGDAIGSVVAIHEIQAEFSETFQRFHTAFEDVISVFDRLPLPSNASPAAMNKHLIRMGVELKKPVSELDTATSALSQDWTRLDSNMSNLTNFLKQGAIFDAEQRRNFRENLAAMERGLDLPQASQFADQLVALAGLSNALRPAAQSMERGLRVLDTWKSSIRNWRTQLESP